MKKAFLLPAALLISLSASAFGQVGIYIRREPPPIRYENPGPPPYQGAYWVAGYCQPDSDGDHYRWVSGRWERPPYTDAYWSHPHYDHYEQGWRLHPGHWDHDDDQSRGRNDYNAPRDRDDHHDHDDHDRPNR